MQIQAVLFDLDGTLVDSNDQHVMAWAEVFRREGVSISEQAIHDQVGKGADNFVPALLPHANAADIKRLGDLHREIYTSEFLDSIQPFDGAHGLLVRVHESDRRIVFASSASEAELDHYIDLLDARDLVAAMTSADDVERTKPAPDIFAAALAKVTPLTAEQVLVVGDTPYDVISARGCNIQTVAVRSGKFSDEVLREAGAAWLYNDVAALLAEFDSSPLSQ